MFEHKCQFKVVTKEGIDLEELELEMIDFGIQEIFEEEGFVWGGKWHLWDNMHFEYRPELILKSRVLAGELPRPQDAPVLGGE